MATTPSVYEQSNSFVELRQTHPEHASVRARIERLAAGLDSNGATDYRTSIVREAYRELLAPDSSRVTLRDFVIEEISRLDDDELARYLYYRFRYEVFPAEYRLDEF